MATVPGTPMQDATGGIPRELQPTQADLLMAAAIMHSQGKFDQTDQQPERVAGDYSQMRPSTNIEDVRNVPWTQRGEAPRTLEAARQLAEEDAMRRKAQRHFGQRKQEPEEDFQTRLQKRLWGEDK